MRLRAAAPPAMIRQNNARERLPMPTTLTRRRILAGAAGLTATAFGGRASRAAGWRPTEQVRIIAPAAPGGTTDLMARLLGQHLQVAWGQTTVVENKSGGGGTIAMSDFVRQKPDGHTIMLSNPGPNAVAYSIFRNMTYKPDQLQPVSNLIRTPNIISVHPSVPVKSIRELMDHIKANPEKLSYATSGVGQSPHLTAAWFLQLTGLAMPHVPFRGAGPALTAVLGGQVPVLFDNLFPSLPQAREGKLRALAVTTPERSFQAPEIPTMRESAPELAKFDVSSWFGVMLPRGAPQGVLDALNAECKAFLDREDTRTRIREIGAVPDHGTPAQYTAFVQAEIAKFGEIIAKEKLQMDIN
jgi:tripartite-type tricarboxylate transporter receptor subunit TctC